MIRNKLIAAVTEYDRKQVNKRGYNPYALGQYFECVDRVMADIDKGASVRAALLAAFNDRLLDHCLRAVGEPVSLKEELNRGPWHYVPASETSAQ